MKCPQCGNENQPDAIFCDQCGTRLVALPVSAEPTDTASREPATPAGVCPQCGAANTPGEMFCSECGAPLDAPLPEAATVESVTPSAPAEAVTPEPDAPAGQQDAPPAAITCPQCGEPIEPGDIFCAKCGAALDAAQAAPTDQSVSDAEATEPTAAAQATPLTECPSCGAQVTPGDAFCDFCGAALVGPTATPQATAVAPAASASSANVAPQPTPTPAAGGPYLMVVATGARINLPEMGEALVGREDPLSSTFPDVDLTPHGGEEGGVSRRHFKITLGDNQFAIQDLNSTNATWLNHNRLQPGFPVALHDGDEIRAGLVKLVFYAG